MSISPVSGPLAVPEQPEGRPYADRIGHPDPRRGAAVRELELAARVDAPGNEIGGASGWRLETRPVAGLQHQHAVLRAGHRARGQEADRLARVDISLLFVVDPEFGADDVPFAAVERSGVEFVGKDKAIEFAFGRCASERSRICASVGRSCACARASVAACLRRLARGQKRSGSTENRAACAQHPFHHRLSMLRNWRLDKQAR